MNNQAILSILQQRIGSADWTKWQIHRWCFYDYVRLVVAGTGQMVFFANPLGGTDPTSSLAKTTEQCNFPKPRSFGQVYFIIQEIRTHVHVLVKTRQPTGINNLATSVFGGFADMNPALVNLLQQGVLNIGLGQKDYFDIVQPFLNAPPGFGLDVWQWATNRGATPTDYITQSPHGGDVYALSPPQLIDPEQSFNITIDFPAANTPTFLNLVNSASPAIDVGVILDGYIARPAQ